MASQNTEMGNGFKEIAGREMGFSHPKSISLRVSASEGIVKKIDLYGKLNGHEGCVNAVEFNSTGDMLVSDDREIVTSAADGQVRLGEVLENGHVKTKMLGRHHDRIYKLAVEPGNPNIFYSCGEDGSVQHQRLQETSEQNKTKCHCDKPKNPHYFSVGGSDEYARVYDIRTCRWTPVCHHSIPDTPAKAFCPRHLRETNSFRITGLAYSNAGELLVSYSDELIYLFQKNMGFGSSPTSVPPEILQEMEEPQVSAGHRKAQTAKGVNFFGPNDEYIMSGSDCGHTFIWQKGDSRRRIMYKEDMTELT